MKKKKKKKKKKIAQLLTTLLFVFFTQANCQNTNTKNQTEAWAVKEDKVNPDEMGEQILNEPDMEAVSQKDLPVSFENLPKPNSTEWPELNLKFELHHSEETVTHAEAHSIERDRIKQKNLNNNHDAFRGYRQMSIRTQYIKQAQKTEDLFKSTSDKIYLGTNLSESDKKYHLYQCDNKTEGKFYVRDDGYVECTDVGQLQWHFKKISESRSVPNCPGLNLKTNLPTPWSDRYIDVVSTVDSAERPKGITYREVAYWHVGQRRVQTSQISLIGEPIGRCSFRWPTVLKDLPTVKVLPQ